MNARLFLPPVPGVHRREAFYVFRFALQQGMSWKRARCLAVLASYNQSVWTFQRTVAAHVGCVVRTVQRAIDEGKRLGILRSRRSRQGEVPPAARGPIKCGCAIRTFTAWGLRSWRRIGAVCARFAHQDVFRRMRAAENAIDRAEARAAAATLRAPPPEPAR